MPVLALAIVVEARAVSAKWVPGEYQVVKSIQGLTWAAPLVLYTFAIPACFKVLAGNKVSAWWPSVISFAIQLGVSSLILNPAVELLVRSHARFVARLLGAASLRGVRRSMASVRRNTRRLERTVQRGLKDLDWMEIQIRSMRWQLDQKGRAYLPKVQNAQAEIARELGVLQERRAKLIEVQKELKSRPDHILEEYAEIRAERLRRFEAVVSGVGIPKQDAPEATADTQDRTQPASSAP